MLLVRHGQSVFNAVFNATREDPGIEDPPLTDQGVKDARIAARELARLAPDRTVHRILASPYTRTLATAEIVRAELSRADRALPVTVEALARERAGFHCDYGSPRSALAARFPAIDFGALAENWWHRQDLYGAESEAALALRCRHFAEKMAAGEWRGAVVVSHWGFIRALTGEAVPNGAVLAFDPAAYLAGAPAVSRPR